MARKCVVTGKSVMTGNNVSHANNRTRRRFLPNLQQVSLLSDVLGQKIKMRITTRGLRTIEFHGGIDAYLTKAKSGKLAPELLKLKKVILKRKEAQNA